MTNSNASEFRAISESAFEILNECLDSTNSRDPLVWLYGRFSYLAESTSSSVRMLVSSANLLPAIALARVRLEQIVVTSYLIHEEADVALTPYLKHYPIDAYRSNKGAIEVPDLAKHLAPAAHEATYRAAQAAKAAIDQNFDGTDAMLNRSKWTKLDLLSMARRRDVLTKGAKGPSAFPLELSYASFYRDFSSVVHTSSMGISPDFVTVEFSSGGRYKFRPLGIWADYLTMTLASWDILNVFELLKAMEIDREPQLKALNSKWNQLRDTFFAEKDKKPNKTLHPTAGNAPV